MVADLVEGRRYGVRQFRILFAACKITSQRVCSRPMDAGKRCNYLQRGGAGSGTRDEGTAKAERVIAMTSVNLCARAQGIMNECLPGPANAAYHGVLKVSQRQKFYVEKSVLKAFLSGNRTAAGETGNCKCQSCKE